MYGPFVGFVYSVEVLLPLQKYTVVAKSSTMATPSSTPYSISPPSRSSPSAKDETSPSKNGRKRKKPKKKKKPTKVQTEVISQTSDLKTTIKPDVKTMKSNNKYYILSEAAITTVSNEPFTSTLRPTTTEDNGNRY